MCGGRVSTLLEDAAALALAQVEVVRDRALAVEEPSGAAVGDNLALLLSLEEVLVGLRREAPLAGLDDELPSRELELAAAEGFDDLGFELRASTARDEDLANLDAGGEAVRLAVGATHAGLEPVSAGAGKHLVDTEHVVRVDADAHVEVLLANLGGEVLVGANAGSLEGLGGQLWVGVGGDG